jgi:RNA polymerase sigma factor (sigma-70 family)
VDSAPTLVPSNPKLFALIDPEDDASILRQIGGCEGRTDRADAAWEVFYTRHRDWLWRKCYSAADALGGITWVREIFQDTLLAVLSSASRFRLPADVPSDGITPHVRAWMGPILKNNLCSRLRDRRKQNELAESLASQISSTQTVHERLTEEVLLPLPYQSAFEEAFASLTEREQTVLRVTFQFYRFGEKAQRLPTKELAEVAEQLKITPENLRAIRMRSMRKLRDLLKPYLPDRKPDSTTLA